MNFVSTHVLNCNVTIQNPILLKAQGMGFKASPKAKEPWKAAGWLAYIIDTCPWVLNTIVWYQIPFKESLHRFKGHQKLCSQKASSSIKGRRQVLAAKGCNFTTDREHRRVLFNTASSPQKEWTDEANHQSQSVGGSSTLQDGGHCNSGLLETGGLDGKSRSKGRLLHHSNSSLSPTVFEVHSGRALLPVHLPSIWSFMCPMDLHQGNESSDLSVEG